MSGSNMMLVTAARQLPQLRLQLEELEASRSKAVELLDRYERLKAEAEETLKNASTKEAAVRERIDSIELLFATYKTSSEDVLRAFEQEPAVSPLTGAAQYHDTACHVCDGLCQRGTEGGAAYVMLPGGGRVLVCSDVCITRMMEPEARTPAKPKPKPKKAAPVADTVCERCRVEKSSKRCMRRKLRGRFCQKCINSADNFLTNNGVDGKWVEEYLTTVPSTKAPGIKRGTVVRAGREFKSRRGTSAAPANEATSSDAPVASAPPTVSMEDLITAAEMWRDGTDIDAIADCLNLDSVVLGNLLSDMSKSPSAVAPEPEPEPAKKTRPLRLTEAELGPLVLSVLNGSDASWPAAKLANELAKSADAHDRRFTGRRLISDITRYLDTCAERGGVVRNENVAGKGVTYRRKYNPHRNKKK